MGQTLTHGIYLPDEGERNCYAGLAANWSILDGAVGTVAEHTTQIAGKAPLVHTHTKADITDFPAYGNAAGTICEGNDSRLSDARTPVAHTHTKSDVTDLLNSNFVPSANNSYDLGSSSYQWNNLYAKNYYYNGTQWGLDVANTWTGQNTFTSPFVMQESSSNTHGYVIKASFARGTAPSANTNLTFRWQDSNGVILGFLDYIATSATYAATLNVRTENNGSQISESVQLETDLTGSYFAFKPLSDGNVDLGTSSRRWKTLNGINPGALSLPKGGNTENTDWFDISSYITNVAGSSSANTYVAPSDGWIALLGKDEATSSIFMWNRGNSGICASAYGNGTQGTGRLAVMLPVRKGMSIGIVCKFSSASDLYLARFFPCEGNV